MAVDVDLNNLAPFFSAVLLEAGDEAVDDLLNPIVAAAAEEITKATPNTSRKIVRVTAVEEDGDLRSQAIIYSEIGSPSWLRRDAPAKAQISAKTYELLVISVRGKFAAISGSDASMRDRVVERQGIARRVSRDTIRAFIGGDAKALWLQGVHTPTSSKADTKTLTGQALADALDPIGDQSYFYSAVRSEPEINGYKKGANRAQVGVAPAAGRLWIRRAGSWPEYKTLLGATFDIAASPPAIADPFATLSRPLDSIADVGLAYALVVVPPQLLAEDEDTSAGERELLHRWAVEARYEVQDRDGASLEVGIELSDEPIGRLRLDFQLESDGVAKLTHQWIEEPAGREAERAESERFVTNPRSVKVFYDTGHCMAQGRFYEGGYTDQQFDWDFRSFDDYSIGDEKPEVPTGSVLADRIAQHNDNSLFAWVVEKMFVDDQGAPTGWLASDDGSMEAADFIHIDNSCSRLTLVHVKAASNSESERQAAPSDYEVVVGQAVKNLRHLDRRHLRDELEKGKSKQIGAAVWHNGVKQPDRQGFLEAAGNLKARAKRVLVVLQPRISKSEHAYCWSAIATPSRAMRIKQVETLMLAARVSAQACGAEFIGIAAEA